MGAEIVSYYALIDSDVLIDVLRQDTTATQVLAVMRQQGQLAVSVVTRMEIVVGCRDKTALQRAERLLKTFAMLPLNEHISMATDVLITAYYLSSGLRIPDALIAATAVYHAAPLLTKNQRDFRFIPDLQLLPYPGTPA